MVKWVDTEILLQKYKKSAIRHPLPPKKLRQARFCLFRVSLRCCSRRRRLGRFLHLNGIVPDRTGLCRSYRIRRRGIPICRIVDMPVIYHYADKHQNADKKHSHDHPRGQPKACSESMIACIAEIHSIMQKKGLPARRSTHF